MEYKFVNTNTHRSDREKNVTMTTNRTERNGTQANRFNFTCRKFVFIWIYKDCRCIYERFKFFKLHEMSVIIACESIREVILRLSHRSIYFLLERYIGCVCVCVFILKQRRMKYGAFGVFVRSREKSVCKTNIFSLITFQNPFYFWCLWVETTRRYYYSWDFFTDNEMAYIWEPFYSRDSIAFPFHFMDTIELKSAWRVT